MVVNELGKAGNKLAVGRDTALKKETQKVLLFFKIIFFYNDTFFFFLVIEEVVDIYSGNFGKCRKEHI